MKYYVIFTTEVISGMNPETIARKTGAELSGKSANGWLFRHSDFIQKDVLHEKGNTTFMYRAVPSIGHACLEIGSKMLSVEITYVEPYEESIQRPVRKTRKKPRKPRVIKNTSYETYEDVDQALRERKIPVRSAPRYKARITERLKSDHQHPKEVTGLASVAC